MEQNISIYQTNLKKLLDNIQVTDIYGKQIEFNFGILKTCEIVSLKNKVNKLIFIGNGASASISSHMSTDFWKNGGVRAVSFNDAALLTCVSNDFGYEYVFEKPIGMFAEKGDVLFAISSSGRSENIIKGVQTARSKGCKVVTLSGLYSDNLLRTLGDINFFVPSKTYGHTEVVHHYICHCILDNLEIADKNG